MEQCLYLTRRQLAERLNVSYSTISNNPGKFPPFHSFSGAKRYLITDVENWERQQRVTPSMGGNVLQLNAHRYKRSA